MQWMFLLIGALLTAAAAMLIAGLVGSVTGLY